jgi:hypothetical protein
MIDTSSTQYFVAGWAVILFSIWLLSKYEGTRTALYYLFWLGVVLDLVSHSEEIYYLYSVIFNLTGQATTGEQYGPNPLPSGPGTIENNPTNGGVKTNPGNGNNPVKSLPSIIENYVF